MRLETARARSAITLPQTRLKKTAVWTAFLTPALSPFPMHLAITTVAPVDIPTKRLTTIPITGVLHPTAAIAILLAKRPTTMTSAALKNCWRIPVRARGIAN